MSLLSHNKLLELQKQGVIENSLPGHVNSASIDVTLGEFILVESHTPKIISLRNRQPIGVHRFSIREFGWTLKPGDFILASSKQVFNLPDWVSGEYKLKSSMARIGLEHMNAGWMDAGWHGSVLTLELKNVSQYHSIVIHEGDLIGQVTFFEHANVPADKSYAVRGRYNNDTEVSGIKP